MGRHCTDCVFGTFALSEKTGKYQGACSRGYTLTDPKVTRSPDNRLADDPSSLVPTVDPLGKDYLRTSNVCEHFTSPNAVIDASSERIVPR